MEHASDDEAWILRYGPIELDLLLRAARISGRPIELPPIQFCMLAYMLAHRGRPIATEEFCSRVLRTCWRPPVSGEIGRELADRVPV